MVLNEEYLISRDIADVWNKFNTNQQFDLVKALLDGKNSSSLASLGNEYKSLKKLPDGVDGGLILSKKNKLSGKNFNQIINTVVDSVSKQGWNTDSNKFLKIISQINQNIDNTQAALIKNTADDMLEDRYKIWVDKSNAYNNKDEDYYKLKSLLFLSTDEADDYISNLDEKSKKNKGTKLKDLLNNILKAGNVDAIKNLLRDNQDKVPSNKVYDLIKSKYKEDGKSLLPETNKKDSENYLLFDYIKQYILPDYKGKVGNKSASEVFSEILKSDSSMYKKYIQFGLDTIRNSNKIGNLDTLNSQLNKILNNKNLVDTDNNSVALDNFKLK